MKNSSVSSNKRRGGRPRLYDTGEFIKAVCEVLPHHKCNEMSQNEVARTLGISVRSLKRYMDKEGVRLRMLCPLNVDIHDSSKTKKT